MGKQWRFALGVVWALAGATGVTGATAHAVELTTIEHKWLHAALPVLRFASEQDLPLDIVVRPQAMPGATPLGMAFVDGRCKLVLSMRGNFEAQATLDRIEPSLVNAVVEAITAHELAHCWRHLQQTWGSLPEGLDNGQWRAHVSHEQAKLLTDMWRTQREEAYADLVGLAWTLKHNPDRYEEVHAWKVRVRANQVINTGPHDTRLWVELARDRRAFGAAASIFEQVRPLWVAGLRASF